MVNDLLQFLHLLCFTKTPLFKTKSKGPPLRPPLGCSRSPIPMKSLLILRSFFTRTYKSKFVRNVAIVASGTAGAQLIAVAFAPIITRLYGPEAFGLLGTFMAIVGVFTPIAALSYPIAIILPKDDSDAKGLARLSVFIGVGMAAIFALVLLVIGKPIVDILHIHEIRSFILLIPVVMIFSAWLQVNEQWLIRKKMFKIAARVAVLQAFITNGANVGIGIIKPLGEVLICVYTFGSALHSFMLAWGAKSSGRDQQKQKSASKSSTWELALRHYDFPLYRAPQMFLNGISLSLPVFMLAAFFGTASAGYFVLCRKLLGMPAQLIAKSVGDVFYPRITEAAHMGEDISLLILKATLALAAVGFVPFGLIILFGPWLFGCVFGAEWVVSGEYARWLGLWMFFMFINNPSIKALPILSAQGFYLWFNFVTIIIRFAVLAAGYYIYNNDLIAVGLFGTSGALINIFLIAIILLKSRSLDTNRFRGTT